MSEQDAPHGAVPRTSVAPVAAATASTHWTGEFLGAIIGHVSRSRRTIAHPHLFICCGGESQGVGGGQRSWDAVAVAHASRRWADGFAAPRRSGLGRVEQAICGRNGQSLGCCTALLPSDSPPATSTIWTTKAARYALLLPPCAIVPVLPELVRLKCHRRHLWLRLNRRPAISSNVYRSPSCHPSCLMYSRRTVVWRDWPCAEPQIRSRSVQRCMQQGLVFILR